MQELERALALEDQTAGEYRSAFDGFQRNRTSASALAQLIEHTIMPELQAARERLNRLERVPPEQQQLVGDADEYLRLRHESWLRAEGLSKINTIVEDPAIQT